MPVIQFLITRHRKRIDFSRKLQSAASPAMAAVLSTRPKSHLATGTSVASRDNQKSVQAV